MADEKIEKEELEELEQEKEQHTFESESYISKFINAGLLALGSKLLFKNNKNADLLKAGTVIAGSYLLSKDEDYSKDTVVLATMFGASSGLKYASELAKTDVNTYAKFSKYAKKADSFVNNFNLLTFNAKNKLEESQNLYNSLYKSRHKIDDNAGFLETGLYTAKSFAFSTYKSLGSGLSYLYNNGLSSSLEEINKSAKYLYYKNKYADIPISKLDSLISNYKDDLKLKLKQDNVGFFSAKIDSFVSALPNVPKSFYQEYYDKIKELKTIKKLQKIENNSFFSDILGSYTNYENGVVDIDLSRILEDGAHFGRPLRRLAYNFTQTLEVNKTPRYLSKKDKEQFFIQYLRDNGFDSIVDNYYKNDNYISFGEVGKRMSNFRNDDRLSKFMNSATKSQTNFLKIESDEVLGVEYEDILKNFAFTNVVKKLDDKNFSDVTTLNGSITALKTLGVLEKNAVGAFKLPLYEKQYNLWNPFSLIDSNTRIKNIIMNDYLGFAYNRQGFFLDGSRIAEKKLIDYYEKNDQVIKQTDITNYITMEDNVKMVYNKSLLDILNDNYSPKNEFKKRKISYHNLYRNYNNFRKEHNFIDSMKLTFSDFSNSFSNPFSFRYKTTMQNGRVKGKFTFVDYKDGYFKDEPFIQGVKNRNKNDFIISELSAENKVIQDTAVEIRDHLTDELNKIINKNGNELNVELDAYDKTVIGKQLRDRVVKYSTDSNGEYLDFSDNFWNYYDNITNLITNKQSASKINKLKNDIILKTNSGVLSEAEFKALDAMIGSSMFNSMYKSNYLLTDILSSSEAFKTIYSSKFFDNKSAIYKNLDNILQANDFYKNEVNYNTFKMMHTFVDDVEKSINNSQKIVFNKLHEKYALDNNFLDNFFDSNDVKDYNNVSNNLYELVRGYELNKAIKKFNFEWKKTGNNEFKNPFDYLANLNILARNKKVSEHSLKDYPAIFKNMMFNNIESAFNLTEESKEQSAILKKFFKNVEFNKYYINPKSYKFYNDISDALQPFIKDHVLNADVIEKSNFFELMEHYYSKVYKNIPEPSSSVMIKRINLENISVKNILKTVKETIDKIISDSYSNSTKFEMTYTRTHNKKKWIQRQMKDRGVSQYKIDAVKDSITTDNEKTKEFKIENLDSHANLLGKTAINQLQNALEFIGIERIPEKQLGITTFQQIKNFTKYRYLPLLAVATGAIAIDSASDAFIPDEVPIVGNGISGVAAKSYAVGRVGVQMMLDLTGGLSILQGLERAVPGLIDNTLGNSLDLLMSPSEMIDVYFNGKPIEIKNNRWWFTAGRQSGEGEEFRQYRPHLLYIAQNKDSGIYSNKIEKLFRQDFLFTKYPWYILDPYKEEREAYEKYGALYPKTEQLFAELPVFGGLINATIGEVIKPTQYIGEDQWRVSDNLIRNPHYEPSDPSSPEFIKFEEPNKLIKSFFDAAEDLKTFAGIAGYGVTKATENLFGTTNPYENEVNLSSIDQDIGAYSKYDRLQLGDLFGMTEPIRRLIDDPNALGMININPLEQNLPEWMPDYFRKGNNPYMSWDFGSYILPGETFDKGQDIENDELKRFRILSMIAPGSADFENSKQILNNNLNNFSKEEQQYFYESLGYASEYGKRDYIDRFDRVDNTNTINLTIDKKISPYEFISDGKRYKLDTVETDYNKLSKIYGKRKAFRLMNQLDKSFEKGKTYSFQISDDATYAVGSDKDGDFFRIENNQINKDLNLSNSGYKRRHINFGSVFLPYFAFYKNRPSDISSEKIIGNKSVYSEWSNETVQAPFFRDWDSPISSFIEPFYTYSANSLITGMAFNSYANDIYMNSNASFNALGLLSKIGMIQRPLNLLFDHTSTSEQYKEETQVHDEIEKIKFLAGDKSFYNMTGKETVKQFSKMVNEQDAEFLEDLVNVKSNKEREKILQSANHRLSTVLKTIWNRHQETLNNTLKYNDVEIGEFEDVLDIGAYYGNSEDAKNQIKKSLGISLSKLDAKRQGIFNAYRGIQAEREADFISNRLYRRYNVRPYISSTIYGQGTINVNMKGDNNY